MSMRIAALRKHTGRIAILTLAALGLAASATAVQAQTAAENSTIAMRVTPSASSNVTVVPKNSAAEAEIKAFQPPSQERDQMRDRVQDTVREQLRALVKGDAAMAFANLSPQTQRYFAEPQRFMSSVATKAPPIVRTKSFAFVGLEQDRGEALQQVLLTDENGRSWLANFRVERQLAGDWRVKSCVVEAVPGQQA